MNNHRPVSTPIPPHFKLSAIKGELPKAEEEFMRRVPYSNALSSLVYAMIGIRPDITYRVSFVNRFIGKPYKVLECS